MYIQFSVCLWNHENFLSQETQSIHDNNEQTKIVFIS